MNIILTNFQESKAAQKVIIENYPAFTKLAAVSRNGISRLDHTLNALNHLYFLLTDNYEMFAHLDCEAISEKFHVISKKQFHQLVSIAAELCSISDSSVNKKIFKIKPNTDLHFMFLLILTHDYGCIDGMARHFVRSGILCQDEFRAAGFSNDQINIAAKIIGNHSYIGDLFLGEASVKYGIALYTQFSTHSVNPEKEWKRLLLLTALDMQSTRGGFLSSEKWANMAAIQSQTELKKLNTNWTTNRFVHLIKHITFSDNFTKHLPANIDDIYFQYFYYIARQQSEAELILSFQLAGEFCQLRDQQKIDLFQFIVFSGDNDQQINLVKQHLTSNKPCITIISKKNGYAGLIPWEITADGYLEFQLAELS